MPDNNIINRSHVKPNLLYLAFYTWTFILICRPQDYLTFLAILRPNLSLGLLTLSLYILSGTKTEKMASNKQYKLYKYLIFVLIIGVPFSYYRSASLIDVFNYSSVSLMFFFLFYQLVNTTNMLRNFLFAYCFGVAIYAIFVLKSGSLTEGRIAFGTMFDANDTAFYLISFIPFNLLFIARDNKAYIKFIAVINILISLIVILKTGSRGGLIALLCIAAYLIFTNNVTIKLSFMKKAVLIFMTIVSLQIISINSERYKTLLDIKDDYNVTAEEGRVALWKTGMKLMLSHPLTGVGMNRIYQAIGQYREEHGERSKLWQTAHNSLIQIGAETGIFGIIIFILLSNNAFKIFRKTSNISLDTDLSKIGEVAAVGMIGHFISAMFVSQAYSIYWVFYIALSAVLCNMSNIIQQS